MPALLTRMLIAPCSAAMASTRVSTAALSQTSSTRPLPPWSASRAAMACAPPSLVAVPFTVAPLAARRSAIAAPIPRLAPVTRATSPFSNVFMELPRLCGTNRSRPGFTRRIEVGRRAQGLHVDALVDPAHQSREHLARPAFRHAGDSFRLQLAYAIRPAHRQIQLANQRIAQFFERPVHAGIGILHDR